MPDNHRPPLLDEILQNAARRYRVPAVADAASQNIDGKPASRAALAIEVARVQLEDRYEHGCGSGNEPGDKREYERNNERGYEADFESGESDGSIKSTFLAALDGLIRQALQGSQADPVFLAMLLHHQAEQVREYAALSAQADQDRRTMRNIVNAIAHPAKQQRASSAQLARALHKLHEAASAGDWTKLAATARKLLEQGPPKHSPEESTLVRILEEPALARLQRLVTLESDEQVQQYQALRSQAGPRSGSADASAAGAESRKRGASTEARTAQAIQALAERLNQESGSHDAFRVVTSLRVPAAIVADARRGKGEWDTVLLQRSARQNSTCVPVAARISTHGSIATFQQTSNASSALENTRFQQSSIANHQASDEQNGPQEARPAANSVLHNDTPIWNVCLLVEAKASADAATKDLPRLLRGVNLLAQADANTTYSFSCREGTVQINGQSLVALKLDLPEPDILELGPLEPPGAIQPSALQRSAPKPDTTKLKQTVLYCCDELPENGTRLLSAASRMQLLSTPASLNYATKLQRNQATTLQELEPVWRQLLNSPHWRPVLHQYQTMRQARDLMVHPDDLLEAIRTSASS